MMMGMSTFAIALLVPRRDVFSNTLMHFQPHSLDEHQRHSLRTVQNEELNNTVPSASSRGRQSR